MEKVKTNPDEYIKSLPDEIRPAMTKLDKAISKIMKGEERVLWTGTFWGGSEQHIIGYGDLKYERKGKIVEWLVVGLALQKNYISLYVNAVADNRYMTEIYGPDLGKVKIGKSSISFKDLDAVNMEKLLELVTKAREWGRTQALAVRAGK